MTRGRKLWFFSGAGALLLFGCLIAANILASRFHLRADFSEGNLYSLSEGSKRILRSMDTPIDIRVYFSGNLQPELASRRSYLEDILQEYQEASQGRVRARFIEVDKDDEKKNEALKEGVVPVNVNVYTKERIEVRQAFMGLVVSHENGKEVLPLIGPPEEMEYDLTTRILQLTREKKKIVGLLSSHGALSPEGLHVRVREWLEKTYELRPIDLRSLKPGATVPAEVSSLLVLGPTELFPDYHLYTLDQFLLSGRPLVFALDARRTDMRSFTAAPLDTGLSGMLRRHGLETGKDLVLDAQNQQVQISQKRGWMTFMNIVDYPLFVVSTDLDREHPVTRQIKALTLPLTARVIVSTPAASGAHQVLVRSSKFSWINAAWKGSAVFNISPLQAVPMKDTDEKGPFVLAVAARGPFKSCFSTHEEAERPVPEGADRASFIPESGKEARFILIGTSRFAHPEMPAGEQGASLLRSLIDWTALDDDIVSINKEGLLFRPLREIPASSKAIVRWINILAPILFVTGIGFLRMRLRAGKRRGRVEAYAPRRPADADEPA